jgi:hypothetical protein
MDPIAFLESQSNTKLTANTSANKTTIASKQSASTIKIKEPITDTHTAAPVVVPSPTALSTSATQKYQYQII